MSWSETLFAKNKVVPLSFSIKLSAELFTLITALVPPESVSCPPLVILVL